MNPFIVDDKKRALKRYQPRRKFASETKLNFKSIAAYERNCTKCRYKERTVFFFRIEFDTLCEHKPNQTNVRLFRCLIQHIVFFYFAYCENLHARVSWLPRETNRFGSGQTVTEIAVECGIVKSLVFYTWHVEREGKKYEL